MFIGFGATASFSKVCAEVISIQLSRWCVAKKGGVAKKASRCCTRAARERRPTRPRRRPAASARAAMTAMRCGAGLALLC